MKRYKVNCAVIIVMCVLLGIGVWVDAIDFSGMYENAKNTATSVINKAKGVAISIQESVSSALSNATKALIKSQEKAVIENPYKYQAAIMRRGNELHPDERSYRQQRLPKVKMAFEKMLNRSLDTAYIPTIAVVGSGGGVRAALCTIGALAGAEKIGLLDATTYITALSGSSWALSAWYAYGTAFSWMKAQDLRNYFSERITRTIFRFDQYGAKSLADMFAVKIAYDQPITTVDLYGGFLANRFFGGHEDRRQMVHLSEQAKLVKNGDMPYPIYTAVDGSEKVAYIRLDGTEKIGSDSRWYEFTPHEIGCAAFETYIPSWAYGRQFNAGMSLDFAPEQSLGFLMGTFGSAYGAHVEMIWRELAENISNAAGTLKPIIEKYVVGPLAGKRAFYAEIYNYMFNVPNIPNAYSNLATRETLKLVDAGLAFNLPYPPISGERAERKTDIIIFLDASAGTVPNEFKEVEKYARVRGLKFPKIDYVGIDKMTMSIFKDESDPTVPVVIYMPRISDAQLLEQKMVAPEFRTYETIRGFDLERCTNEDGICGTFKFEYTQEESQQVMDQMEFNMMVNKDQIVEAISWVIDKNS